MIESDKNLPTDQQRHLLLLDAAIAVAKAHAEGQSMGYVAGFKVGAHAGRWTSAFFPGAN